MSGTTRVDLLAAAGAGAGAAKDWPGGAGVFFGFGTFGGSTVALEADCNPSDTDDFGAVRNLAGTALTLTAAGALEFNLPPCRIRGTVTGGAAQSVGAHATSVKP